VWFIRRPGNNRTISSKLGYRGFGKRVRLTLTRLMSPIHAIPPARDRRGRPRRRPDTLYAEHGYDHDKYRRRACEVGITPLTARRGKEHGFGLSVYRFTLVDHQGGLNSPLWCMMGTPENEVASGELSVADCVNVLRTRDGPSR
jgi:hypothetical protein